MKKRLLLLLFVMIIAAAVTNTVTAQCSICTKTAGQLGEKRAAGLNTGIIYLMLTPFAIAGYIGFRWWKTEKENHS
jgi:hypothetical protein